MPPEAPTLSEAEAEVEGEDLDVVADAELVHNEPAEEGDCYDLGPEIRHGGKADACHDTGNESRGEFHGTVRHTQPRRRNATRLLTLAIWSETWVAMSRNFGADGV